MSQRDTPEKTAGGAVGKVVGKVKEAAGELFGQDDLAREGRLQQAQVDAEVVAETHAAEAEQLQTEQQLEADKQENELERQRLRTEITTAEREAALEPRTARDRRGSRRIRNARRRRSSRMNAYRSRLQQSATASSRETKSRGTGGGPPRTSGRGRLADGGRRGPGGQMMDVLTIPRTAVDRSIRILRLPIDTTVGLLDRDGEKSRTFVLAIDRADATVRRCTGRVLHDESLQRDADARGIAVEERQRALELRIEAELRRRRADAELRRASTRPIRAVTPPNDAPMPSAPASTRSVGPEPPRRRADRSTESGKPESRHAHRGDHRRPRSEGASGAVGKGGGGVGTERGTGDDDRRSPAAATRRERGQGQAQELVSSTRRHPVPQPLRGDGANDQGWTGGSGQPGAPGTHRATRLDGDRLATFEMSCGVRAADAEPAADEHRAVDDDGARGDAAQGGRVADDLVGTAGCRRRRRRCRRCGRQGASRRCTSPGTALVGA